MESPTYIAFSQILVMYSCVQVLWHIIFKIGSVSVDPSHWCRCFRFWTSTNFASWLECFYSSMFSIFYCLCRRPSPLEISPSCEHPWYFECLFMNFFFLFFFSRIMTVIGKGAIHIFLRNHMFNLCYYGLELCLFAGAWSTLYICWSSFFPFFWNYV